MSAAFWKENTGCKPDIGGDVDRVGVERMGAGKDPEEVAVGGDIDLAPGARLSPCAPRLHGEL